ncbi:MAG TPA: sulfatase [Verrucomicrobiae bacterium]
MSKTGTHLPFVGRRLTVLCLLLVVGLWIGNSAIRAETRPPNVVIIFTDDLGYADVGVFGGRGFKTPNLDRMAKEGIRFVNFHVSQAVCSASRAALLTGCYNNRLGIHGALGPGAKVGLNPSEMTIAEVVKQKGYATGMFGKWHLGDHPSLLPVKQGFEEYFGIPYSNDMWPFHPEVVDLPDDSPKKKRWPDLPMIEGDKVVNPKLTPEDQTQLTTWYTERAVKFIEKNKAKPFFLYVAHNMPHVPLYVSDKFKGKSEKGVLGDVLMEIDWSVGEILRTLSVNGLDENTLVIFTSDNGPWLSYGTHAGSAGPLREGKGTSWEGGVRVPFIARWPGKIPQNRVSEIPTMTIDLLPTIAGLVGAPLPEKKIDGKDIWPLLKGDAQAKSPHEAYYIYYANNQLQAVISGQWKLFFPHTYRTLGDKSGGTDGKPAEYQNAKTELELYDLKNDLSETTNVAAKNPEIVVRLQQLAELAREDLGDSLTNRKGNGVREPGRVTN